MLSMLSILSTLSVLSTLPTLSATSLLLMLFLLSPVVATRAEEAVRLRRSFWNACSSSDLPASATGAMDDFDSREAENEGLWFVRKRSVGAVSGASSKVS